MLARFLTVSPQSRFIYSKPKLSEPRPLYFNMHLAIVGTCSGMNDMSQKLHVRMTQLHKDLLICRPKH